MLYSGAKGTMTPNNRLQRTALPHYPSAFGQCHTPMPR
jgi:hypothetical protein